MSKIIELNIFCYGEYACNDLKDIVQTMNNVVAENDNEIEYLVSYNSEETWKYFIFEGEINDEKNEVIKNMICKHSADENMSIANEEIKKLSDDENTDQKVKKILSEYRKFFDILILSVQTLSDENSKKLFKFFHNISQTKNKQPFILFLTKKEDNPKVEQFYELITNEFYDKRNLFAFKFPKNEYEKIKINDFFIKCMNYYHEISLPKFNIVHSFNILICGNAGVGKSTFINQFLQEKQAKEGEGMSVTHEITNYYHPKHSITIYDTPGFEDENTVKTVLNRIKKFDQDKKESKDHLELILYFTQLKPRSFYEMEKKMILYLIENNKNIIFVLNTFGKSKLSAEAKKLKQTFEDSLTQLIKGKIPQETIKSIINNIVLVNPVQSTEEVEVEDEEEEEEKTKKIIKQCFGMDDLFKKINEIFKHKKITINEIEKSKNENELFNNIGKYELLNHIKSIEDFTIRKKINASKEILSYSKYDWFMIFGRYGRRKELLENIANVFGEKIVDTDKLYSDLESEYKNVNDKKKLRNDFFDSIRKFEGTFNTQGFNFDAYFYNEYTLLISFIYLKRLQKAEKEIGLLNEKTKIFIKEFSNTINKSIDIFGDLSNEWKEIYKNLKKSETNIEWVKRFFILKHKKTK
jgi:predicted GTPase